MKFLNRFLQYVEDAKGFKKSIIAMAYGVLVTLALPPVNLWPLAIIGFSGFFLLILKCESRKESFKTGWWFGFGHFVSGLYWIAFALLVDVAAFGWLIPFAVFGIPAVIAFYTAIVGLLLWQVSKRITGWRLVVFFACSWTLIEMLRGWLFTGFPWNLAGYIWSASENMLQFASIAGIWGLSLITVLAFTMPAILALNNSSQKNNKLPIAIACLILIAVFTWGGFRLNAVTEFMPDVKLRLVQANIPQNMKWEEEWRYKTVHKYLEMSQHETGENITHIIWPETALPFVMSENSELLNVIAKITPKDGALITGALRAQYSESGMMQNIWNSMIVVSDKGELYSSYDKSHLVPFGEYVPFRNILPLEKITNGSLDFSSGDGPRTINAPGLGNFGGLVCYEVIFPGHIVEKENSPQVLINATNDAWYGNTSGPYQHFQMARVRAIEEGIPLVRAANNGISGVVDAYGRIIAKTHLSEEAILDVKLPLKIPPTIYGRYGNIVAILLISFLLLIVCRNCIFPGDSPKILM